MLFDFVALAAVFSPPFAPCHEFLTYFTVCLYVFRGTSCYLIYVVGVAFDTSACVVYSGRLLLSSQENCVDFENSRWFNSLLYYGSTTDDVSVDDLDLKLIPSIVEKVLLAKLTGKLCHFLLR